MDSLTLRQAELGLDLPKLVDVIGCGGVGSWVALALGMAGVPEIRLWDGDFLSDHNLNRIPLRPGSAGPKSSLIAQLVMELRPAAQVLGLGRWDPRTADLLPLPSWMIVTTDTLRSRRACHTWCISAGVNYIEAAAEGEWGSAASSPAEWETPEESSPGYASVPVWVGPCMQAATCAVAYILHGTPPQPGMIVRAGWDGARYSFVEK